MSVRKHTVAIPSATSDVGKALSIEYSSPYAVLIFIARNELVLDEIRLQCEELDSEVHCYSVDFAYPERAFQLSRFISKEYTVDLNISNAGQTDCTTEGRAEEWTEVENLLAVNLSGAIAITHLVIKDMQQGKSGQVFYVSSLATYH